MSFTKKNPSHLGSKTFCSELFLLWIRTLKIFISGYYIYLWRKIDLDRVNIEQRSWNIDINLLYFLIKI